MFNIQMWNMKINKPLFNEDAYQECIDQCWDLQLYEGKER